MPKKILVVDDERHIVRLIQVNFERAGYQVVTAYDGVEALAKVELDHPDLITLDIRMPHMDGWEVIKHLKANRDTFDIPIIVVTCMMQDADVFLGWQSGVDAYLFKPLNPLDILAKTRAIFEAISEDE